MSGPKQSDGTEAILLPLDGATPQPSPLANEIIDIAEIARDTDLPLDERMEAFDDVLDSEVGDTTFVRARHIERSVGLRQIFLKFEGGNPTGTQKDRIAFAQAGDALRRGFEALTCATCGNYGAAMALAAAVVGLRCYIYVPCDYHTVRLKEMEKHGATIVREGDDYEAAVVASREFAMREEIYDANPGGANTTTQLHSYGTIAYEIYDELRDAPAAISVPVSNGTTLAGIHRGFMSLYRRGKTSRMPRMVAASSSGKNPIVRSWLKNLPTCEDLPPSSIRETVVNEPLINWHSIDGEMALSAIRETNGWAAGASDKRMVAYAKLLRDSEGLNVLPASSAALIALLDHHKKDPFPGDRYVVVLTGKR